MGEVVQIQPRTLNKRYRNHAFVIYFDTATKLWSWEVTYVETTVFKGDAKDTVQKAQRAAERHIDKTMELKG